MTMSGLRCQEHRSPVQSDSQGLGGQHTSHAMKASAWTENTQVCMSKVRTAAKVPCCHLV